jgi:hypothetical protein
MESSPAKYVIKICVSADVTTYYTHDMQVCTKSKQGEPREKRQGKRVVQNIVSPLLLEEE